TPAPPPSAAQPPAAGGTELGAAADIPVGGGKVFADRQVVVTQPVAGTFAAFSAVCTHQGCTVDTVADGTINCPCHGSKFKIADGSVANGPASQPLAKKAVTVTGGKITLA
ncbi:Rieske (2Fe-2S) protein, partial [Amycolatopsis sp. SID8362]|uniref:Rieske (2Fe-2S) protein n=1 Tax=Amycolatopsis sp. SID8362 TaxID=2690346 RepID=UPI00137063EB